MKLSTNSNIAMEYATSLARVSGGIVGSEHILCGLLYSARGKASMVLRECGVSLKSIQSRLRRYDESETKLSQRSIEILETASQFSARSGRSEISTTDILLALLMDESSYAIKYLQADGVSVGNILAKLKQNATSFNEYAGQSEPSMGADFDNESQTGEGGALDKIGVDLTLRAKQGKLDPVIGRGKEIDRIIQVLSRRTKNNPILIGEPGVGKSAIVEGLAQAIVEGNVPEMLKNKKVFSLDIVSLIAGSKYRGEFEEKLQNAIASIKKDGNIVVFIDEIHTIVGAGASSEGSLDAANILKPLLARGEFQTIGATTLDEHRKHIEKDAALERRFQPIIVDPPNVEDTISILKGLRQKYEEHHKIAISEEAIEAAAILSDRYISDRFLPDKAIDLIDEACSKKRINNFILPPNLKEMEDEINRLEIDKKEASRHENFDKASEMKKRQDKLIEELKGAREIWEQTKKDEDLSIDENDIAQIVSVWTSIPIVQLTESESKRLLNLENVLKERVIGQEEAVNGVARAVRRARAGLKDPNRPIGSFIFLGPTGVGKTELCKALAEAMFGDETLMLRYDMSEYMDSISVSKLIGSAPGYVGYEEGGQLTEKVRRKPYSVVLFDEIEKAHSDVFNILLQILEDGRLTDSHGRTVNFKNTIIILTSNIGATEIGSMPKLGFNQSEDTSGEYEKMKVKQMDALKRTMRPELINRIDEIVIFHKLERAQINVIADIIIENLRKRLKERSFDFVLSVEAKEYIVDKGYDKEYGARPLRRAVQRLLEDRLSEEILRGTITEGAVVYIGKDEEGLTFSKENPEAVVRNDKGVDIEDNKETIDDKNSSEKETIDDKNSSEKATSEQENSINNNVENLKDEE